MTPLAHAVFFLIAIAAFSCAGTSPTPPAVVGKLEFLVIPQKIQSIKEHDDGISVITFSHSARYFCIDPRVSPDAEEMVDLAKRQVVFAYDYRGDYFITALAQPPDASSSQSPDSPMSGIPRVVRLSPTPDPRATH